MAGFPDSHLGDSRGSSRWMRALPIALPLALAIAWMGFYWFTTGVFPVSEKHANGAVKYAGYVRRAGVEAYKPHGHWVTYHANGQKESEGFYELGAKTGAWSYWDESGRPVESPTKAGP